MGGQVGRQAAEGGRLPQLRRPRQQPPRTAPAPANNRIRPQRSGSYRRRHVRTQPRGRLGNGVYVPAPTPKGMLGVGGATGESHSSPAKRLRRRCLGCSGPWESEFGAAAAF